MADRRITQTKHDCTITLKGVPIQALVQLVKVELDKHRFHLGIANSLTEEAAKVPPLEGGCPYSIKFADGREAAIALLSFRHVENYWEFTFAFTSSLGDE